MTTHHDFGRVQFASAQGEPVVAQIRRRVRPLTTGAATVAASRLVFARSRQALLRLATTLGDRRLAQEVVHPARPGSGLGSTRCSRRPTRPSTYGGPAGRLRLVLTQMERAPDPPMLLVLPPTLVAIASHP